ncbi:MAG TPA: threonine/serine dehydratase [Rhizomicrobium sp.]|jgi:threonine dehydratase|nr:threonine/serine dehydratase [Rhizomicrobium sp.]
MPAVTPTLDDVKAAAARIAPYAFVTPLIENAALNAHMGKRVLLKLETLQRTGTFKFRGACNRILMIPEAERGRGVVAFSSGNHAQAVAAVATLFGMKATIVMPADAPRAKIAATRDFGAEVVLYDRTRQSREEIAAAIQAKTGATLVKPFDDPGVVAGQGTAGLEIAAQARALGAEPDCALAPASGGGLVSGIALALSGPLPGARVFSVEPENFASMKLSLEKGERINAQAKPPSQADALMSPFAGEVPFALAKTYVAGGLGVTDAELDVAMSYAACRLKLVVEPGGSAALAALLARKAPADSKCTVVVLSGGNADFETVAAACARVPEP